MSVYVRAASLQDGVAVLELLEEVGYYPDPIAFAKTYRKTMTDPHFLVRVAEEDGKIVGMASLSMRYQLGLGGLLASLDELAVARGHKTAEKLLLQATVGKARSLGARRIVHEGERGHAAAARRPARAAAAAAAARPRSARYQAGGDVGAAQRWASLPPRAPPRCCAAALPLSVRVPSRTRPSTSPAPRAAWKRS